MPSLLDVIVIYLYSENNSAANRCYEIGHKQEYSVLAQHETLYHEANTSNGHHQEGCQCYVIGLPRADSLNGLRQIAKHQTDAGHPTYNVKECLMIHETELLEVETKTYLKAYATTIGKVVKTHVVVDSGLDAHEVIQIEAITSLQSQGDVVVLFLRSVMNDIGFTSRRVDVGFIGFDSRLSFEAIEQTTTQINCPPNRQAINISRK